MSEDIYVLGIGPYSIVISELAEICGYNVAGYYHYNNTRNGENYHGIDVLSSTDELFNKGVEGKSFALSMGNNEIRVSLARKIIANGGKLPNLIHPSVEISKSATIGQGVILKRNVSIQALSEIQDFIVICDNSTVCHHTVIGKGSFIAGSVIVGAYTVVGSNVFIGQGAILSSGKAKNIGNDAVVGASSNVVKPVKECEVVVGNPAKHLKYN